MGKNNRKNEWPEATAIFECLLSVFSVPENICVFLHVDIAKQCCDFVLYAFGSFGCKSKPIVEPVVSYRSLAWSC